METLVFTTISHFTTLTSLHRMARFTSISRDHNVPTKNRDSEACCAAHPLVQCLLQCELEIGHSI